MTAPLRSSKDDRKAARYDQLRAAGKSHEEAVAEIEARPSYLGGVARTAAQGAALGFSDELRGLGEGLGAVLPGGRSPIQAYRAGRDAEREALSEFREDHPKSALAAELIGGVVTPGLGLAGSVGKGVGRAGIGAVMRQGARVGGISGALYGAGSADEGLGDRLAGAARGGVIGATAGAVLPVVVGGVAKGVRRGAEWAGSTRAAPEPIRHWAQTSRAARDADAGAATVLRKLTQDQLSPGDLAGQVADARRVGITDVALPDVAGANTRGLIDLAATRPGPAQESVRQFAEGRAGGMREMLADAFETVSRLPRVMVREAREQLLADRKARANELFETAFQQAGFVDDPALIAAIETVEEASPTFGRKAMELARLHRVKPGQLVSEARVPPDVAAGEMVRAGRGLIPSGMHDDVVGAFQESMAGARRVPSLRYAHYLKEAIDEEIARAQQQVGAGGSGSRLAGLTALKDQLRQAATAASPRYGEALTQFAGDSEMLRALRLGEQMLHSNVRGDELAAMVARMTPGEQQMFRVAGLQSMRSRLMGNTALAPSETNAWWNSPEMRQKMQLLLGDESNMQDFLKAVGLTRNKVLTGRAGGGSQTATRGMADEELGEIMGFSPGEAMSAATGSPFGAGLRSVVRHGMAALKGDRLRQAVPYLTATGPDLDRRLLELALLQQRYGLDAVARLPGQAASGVGIPILTSGNRR